MVDPQHRDPDLAVPEEEIKLGIEEVQSRGGLGPGSMRDNIDRTTAAAVRRAQLRIVATIRAKDEEIARLKARIAELEGRGR